MSITKSGPGVARLATALQELDGLTGKAGFFETSHYSDGTPVAYVASIHEFGAPAANIDARPFMRPAAATYGKSWMDALGQVARQVVTAGLSPRDGLEMVMLKAAGDIGKSISAVTSPALSAATIARKGHDKPLVDTGQMLQSVTGKVE